MQENSVSCVRNIKDQIVFLMDQIVFLNVRIKKNNQMLKYVATDSKNKLRKY